jgi:polyhydroxyalkanoate synthesis regulator phasin
LDSIISKGHYCEEGECTVADVEDLIAELQSQQHNLHERVLKVDKMIESLENLNAAGKRDTDEVRATVKAIFNVFNQGAKPKNKVKVPPTGYSGDVGKGSSDAYKSLNPKPWKP